MRISRDANAVVSIHGASRFKFLARDNHPVVFVSFFPNYLLHGSQVGCQMACTFCATGTMGLKGDLSAGEILEQVLHASRVAPIRNVVFMGERSKM